MTRRTLQDKVDWLLAHPALWEGYPKTQPWRPGKSHRRIIFDAMKAAGLFAPVTNACDVNIDTLISRARFIQRTFPKAAV
jgi:hypothetical protein